MPFMPSTERELEVADVDIVQNDPAMTDWVSRATAYLRIKKQMDGMKRESDRIKESLKDFIRDYGYDTGNGSQALDLPKEIEGVNHLIRQRRATRKFREVEAEALLREKGLWKACTEKVRVLNEDAVMEAVRSGSLSDEDLEIIFPATETFALVTKK